MKLLFFFIIINIQAISVLDKVKELDYKIFNVSKSIEASKSDIILTEKKLENSRLKIDNLKKQNKSLEDSIKNRVKYLFKIINGKDFLFLMDSKDALSLEKKEKFLKIVINNDLNLIKKYLLKLKELNNSIDTYENEIKKLKETQNELIKQKEVLVSERKEKKLYLEKVRKSKSLNKKLQREKKVVSNNVNKKLKSNTKKSGFITMKGSFDFPVNAKVYKWYSVKYIKETKSYEIHKGLTFKVAIGTRVHSIYEGSIVFADYIKGFGKTIIISHGDGYYSIYMHLDSILKKSGDKVVARDIIGLSGASGTTEYPKLYFEIRKKKDSININKWFNIKK